MSTPTVVERVCDVLETILLNGPIEVAKLELATGLERRQLRNYLAAFEEAAFIKVDATDKVDVGERLVLILDHWRARR